MRTNIMMTVLLAAGVGACGENGRIDRDSGVDAKTDSWWPRIVLDTTVQPKTDSILVTQWDAAIISSTDGAPAHLDSAVDAGADADVLLGDLDGDKDVDCDDWALLRSGFGRNDCHSDSGVNICTCDVNDDGRCDVVDLPLLRVHWGHGTDAGTGPTCGNDLEILAGCLGKVLNDACAGADLDGDGDVDGVDLLKFNEGFKYDLSGDGVIDLTPRSDDYAFIADCLSQQPPISADCAKADLNGDKIITNSDNVALRNAAWPLDLNVDGFVLLGAANQDE